MKEGDYFRASSMYRLCPREEVLASKYDIVRIDVHRTDPSLSVTLDIGDAFHDLYREVLFGPMGEWQGAWECGVCGWDTDVDGLSEPPCVFDHDGSIAKLASMPKTCPNCGAVPFDDNGKPTRNIRFKEWHVCDRELLIHGHMDGWSVSGKGRILVDLKSQSTRGYHTARSIINGHDIQVTTYQYLTGEKRGEVWYLNKSPWGDWSDFVKDLPIDWNQNFFEAYIRRPMLEMREGLSGGRIPQRLCSNKTCPRAKGCQVNEICFDI